MHISFTARRVASFAMFLFLVVGTARAALAVDLPRLPFKLEPLRTGPVKLVCQPIHVAAGGPTLIVLRGDVGLATLTVDGREERVGRRIPTGYAPLGQPVPSFRVRAGAHLGPLCVQGRSVRIEATADRPIIHEAVLIGRLSGFYLGMVSAVSLLILGSLTIAFESSSVFYLLFTMTLLGFAALRAGAHPLGMALDPAQSFLALNVVAAVAVGGFFVEFLRLRHDSPQLYRLVVAVLGLESAIGLAFALTPALAPKLDDLNLVLNVIGTTLLIVVALIRRYAISTRSRRRCSIAGHSRRGRRPMRSSSRSRSPIACVTICNRAPG